MTRRTRIPRFLRSSPCSRRRGRRTSWSFCSTMWASGRRARSGALVVRRWRTGGGGFETFYGFIGGENNQWDPALYDGTTPVEPPATAEEGYHLTEDLADRAINWVRQQKALMPAKPFFVYFAPGATHAPHHVPKELVDRYQGQVTDGWNV